ncbi:MAG: B12-binding domain-containing radical SAM protein [Desulfobacca sp.]|uniref:B12-binding domain-containing radical SAM protein n=1 Tax=Desulfobacca sp. TaxID=2067990 RepID=UPI0040497A6F
MDRPIQNILFIEPRNPRPHIFSRVAIPRLGCVLLGTILRDQGYNVKVVVEEISQPNLASLDFSPDLVCISSITPTMPRALQLGDFYRSQGLPVVIGGPHPSFLPEESLAHADYVICGEADEALPELVAALNTGASLEGIGNLCYHVDGGVRLNPWRPFFQDLDALPIPDYRLIHGWQPGKQGVVSIATSRGCPYGCRFCSVILLFGRKFRYNAIDRVLAEIRQNGSQAKHIFFCDDNFTADRQRSKELMRRMIAENLRVEWSAQVRVDAAKDPELLDLMARSGCYMVFIGLESINPATLQAFKKGQTVADIRQAVTNFHRYGIAVHGMFVFGSEEDTLQVMRDTVKFSHDIDIDSLQYLILTPIPGTPIYDELASQNRLLHQDWQYYDGHHAVFVPRYMTPLELQLGTLRAMKAFYTWPSVLRRLWRRDWFFAKLKAHGRLHLRRSFKEVKQGYFQHLKDQLFSVVKEGRQLLPRRRIRTVGIPEDIWGLTAWESGPKEFLLKFLEKLGVEIVLEKLETGEEKDAGGPSHAERLQVEIARLQEKADIVLLPIWAGLENVRQKAREVQQDLGQLLSAGRKAMPLNFTPTLFFNVCMQLGLMIKARPRLIRRIYFQTLGEVGTTV